MKSHVTVVPIDNLIIVDKVPLVFEFKADANLHALQWHDGKGELEFTDGTINEKFTEEDYTKYVEPFVTLWVQENDAREKALQEQLATEETTQ